MSAIDLVERLRARTEMEDHNGTIYPDMLVNPDGPEAADTITRLQAALDEIGIEAITSGTPTARLRRIAEITRNALSVGGE